MSVCVNIHVKGKILMFNRNSLRFCIRRKTSRNQKYDKASTIKNTTEQEDKRDSVSRKYSFGLFDTWSKNTSNYWDRGRACLIRCQQQALLHGIKFYIVIPPSQHDNKEAGVAGVADECASMKLTVLLNKF